MVVNSRQRLHVVQRNSNMNWCLQVAVGDSKNERSECYSLSVTAPYRSDDMFGKRIF